MLIDANQLESSSVVEADLCIVGSGPAGVSVALEFIDSPVNVCLLESGGEAPEGDTQSLAGGFTSGHTYVPLQSTRLRILGGTSHHWSGWSRPLEDIDFEERSWIPYSGWPLTLDSLHDYYERAHERCDLGPYAYDLDEWHETVEGIIGGGSERLEARIIQFNPVRFGAEFRSQLEAANNIRTILHANVLTLDADQGGKRVQSVSVATLAGKNFKVKAKNFVIATGGLENARLLLLSDQVQKTGLGNANDMVGRFFMNHSFLHSGYVIGARSAGSNRFFSRAQHSASAGDETVYQAYLAFRRSVMEKERIANVSFNLVPSDLSSMIYGVGDEYAWYEKVGLTFSNFDEVFSGAVNRVRAKFDAERREPVFSILNITEQTPNPSSRVTLTSELDRLGQRKMNLDWQFNDIDFSSLQRSHELLGAELARTGTGRVVTDIDELEGWPQKNIGDWHHMGTTRMSADPKQGVVNANCQVYGVDNLFVAGSSVFSTGGYANPTLTIVALAIRLADHIKGRHT